MTGVMSETDDCRHVVVVGFGTSRNWLTRCGQRVAWDANPGDDWPACHICLPREAHPMAAVWRMCERWDRDYEAASTRGWGAMGGRT